SGATTAAGTTAAETETTTATATTEPKAPRLRANPALPTTSQSGQRTQALLLHQRNQAQAHPNVRIQSIAVKHRHTPSVSWVWERKKPLPHRDSGFFVSAEAMAIL